MTLVWEPHVEACAKYPKGCDLSHSLILQPLSVSPIGTT